MSFLPNVLVCCFILCRKAILRNSDFLHGQAWHLWCGPEAMGWGCELARQAPPHSFWPIALLGAKDWPWFSYNLKVVNVYFEPLAFWTVFVAMTGIKLLACAHLFIYARWMYDNARYLFNVHHRTLSIQRKRSIFISLPLTHEKYPLCPRCDIPKK